MLYLALLPVLIAALMAGLGAWAGARMGAPLLPGRLGDYSALAGAIVLSISGYGVVVAIFHRALPLGRLAR